MRVPPNMTASAFSEALSKFVAVVGKEWVFTSDEDVALYRDAYSILWDDKDELLASAAVAPQSLEEVQAVVRIANEYKVPIYPISTGRNLGYGGSAPTYSGSVVLDLKRMNRIIEVDERNASVLVEPGVSYFDLYRHFEEKGVKLLIDCPDPGWGSLVGNALDHGGGYLRPEFRNHFDSHCGMEVVLANGEVMRTGMGAMPGAGSWQQNKYGAGPSLDGIFSQSNFGVVTKMGFWMMPQPEAFLSGTVIAPRYEDLIALVDTVNYLENAGITNGIPSLGSSVYGGTYQNARDPRVAAFVDRAELPSDAELRAFVDSHGIPWWGVQLKYYGVADACRANWEFTKKKFAQTIPGATFEEGELVTFPLSEEAKAKVHKPEFGIPSLEIFTRGLRSESNPEPDWGHVYFTLIIPRTGEAIFEANRVMAEVMEEFGLLDSRLKTRFKLPLTYWQRTFVLAYGFNVTHDVEKNKHTRDAINKMIQVGARHGWGEYRTTPVFQDAVINSYSFNNNILRRFCETIKDAVDPNGILSPGRYGIWPANLRKT